MAETVLAKLAVQVAANTAELTKGLKSGESSFKKFASNITNTAKGLVAGFGLIEIARGVISVTGEFQRFEAVLSNTLGSDSAAQRALGSIKEFATQTPFAVNELTDAFVKLSNQGFQPSMSELRSLGDLASSTGKSFNQLAEAVIDAQVGEFERLKEFGVRAKKSGDQVSFTFKGVTTTVKNTSEGIRDYILSLGEAEGVSGSMSKISQTLEGRISNLGDAWDNLLLTIGQGNKGVLVGAVTSLTRIVNTAANVQKELEIDQVVLGFKDFRDLSKETLDYITDFLRATSGKNISDVISPVTSQGDEQFFANYEENGKRFIKLLEDEGEATYQATVLWARYVQRRTEATKANQADDFKKNLKEIQDARKASEDFFNTINFDINELDTIDKLTEKIKVLTDIRNSSTEKTIAHLNPKIEELQEKLKKLQNLGLESKKGLIPQLEDQIKDLEEAIDKSFNPAEIIDFTQQIEVLQDKINTLKTIGQINLLSNIGIVDFDFEKFNKSFEEGATITQDKVKKFAEQVSADVKKLTTSVKDSVKMIVDFGPSISSGIVSLADALGAALATQDFANFGDAILEAVASFAQQLGSQMVALGVAELALKFASSNPVALIAAGAALVAAGAAVKSSLSKQKDVISSAGGGGSYSGSSGFKSSSSNVSSVSSEAQDIKIEVIGVVKGEDIWLAGKNYEQGRRFTNTTGG